MNYTVFITLRCMYRFEQLYDIYMYINADENVYSTIASQDLH